MAYFEVQDYHCGPLRALSCLRITYEVSRIELRAPLYQG